MISFYIDYLSKYVQNITIEFMNQMIKKIYPNGKKTAIKAETMYLQPLLSNIKSSKKPFYYANFLSSLDGRIATQNKKFSNLLTPEVIKSDIDYNLFCQLHAQADCLVTNTNYVNGLNQGYYGDILSLKNQELMNWRKTKKLSGQKIIILSNSLNFKISEKIEKYKKSITILTTCNSARKIEYFKKNGYKLKRTRGKDITPIFLNKHIIKENLRSVYFIAGPKIVEQMISKKLLDRLYYSINLKIVGTSKYDTLIRGEFLNKCVNIYLKEMFIHTTGNEVQNIFQIYNF